MRQFVVGAVGCAHAGVAAPVERPHRTGAVVQREKGQHKRACRGKGQAVGF